MADGTYTCSASKRGYVWIVFIFSFFVVVLFVLVVVVVVAVVDTLAVRKYIVLFSVQLEPTFFWFGRFL